MSSDFCIKCDNALAVYCGKCVDAEREELNRLRRLVPTGSYTLNDNLGDSPCPTHGDSR